MRFPGPGELLISIRRTRQTVTVVTLSLAVVPALLLFFATPRVPSPAYWVIMAFGVLRGLEILAIQNYQLFTGPRKKKDFSFASYRRLLGLTAVNYLELLFWFATFNLLHRLHFSVSPSDALSALHASIATAVTAGSDVQPVTAYARLQVIIQMVVFLLMNILVVGRIIAVIPLARSRDPHEQ